MRLLTTTEVAMLLNVTDRTVRDWCMKGKLRHLRTPVRYVHSRRILIPEDAVEEFIKISVRALVLLRKTSLEELKLGNMLKRFQSC
jgi:excisionase family DNA binding protein